MGLNTQQQIDVRSLRIVASITSHLNRAKGISFWIVLVNRLPMPI
jgi:hypothetical protein